MATISPIMLNAMIPTFLKSNERQASIKTQSPLITATQKQYVSNTDGSVFNVGMNNPTKIQPPCRNHYFSHIEKFLLMNSRLSPIEKE